MFNPPGPNPSLSQPPQPSAPLPVVQTMETTVEQVLEDLNDPEFVVVAGKRALKRVVRQCTVQRVGVALTGSISHMEHDRIQLLGQSEDSYLSEQSPEQRLRLLTQMTRAGFPALVVSAGRPVDPDLIELAQANDFVLIRTELKSKETETRLNDVLANLLAPCENRHGVFVDVHGIGVLLLGPSGIGKSELGLELIASGHRLVADDQVLLKQLDSRTVVGFAPDLLRHFIEIRGLGILNIKDLFGEASVRDRKRVELVVHLVEWTPDTDYDRLGLDTQYTYLAGVKIPLLTLPVRPGRSMALLIEVAARNHLMQIRGINSAQDFANRLHQQMHQPTVPTTCELTRSLKGKGGIE